MKIASLIVLCSSFVFFAAPSEQQMIVRRNQEVGKVQDNAQVFSRNNADEGDSDVCGTSKKKVPNPINSYHIASSHWTHQHGKHVDQSGNTNKGSDTIPSPPKGADKVVNNDQKKSPDPTNQSKPDPQNSGPSTKTPLTPNPTIPTPIGGGGAIPANFARLTLGKRISGQVTMYGNGDGNACGFPLPPQDSNIFPVAMAGKIFGKGEACGACIEVDPGSQGIKTKVYVIDDCPECVDSLDATKKTWDHMMKGPAGRENITWSFVPCGFSQGAQIKFISVGNMYDFRVDFLQVSDAIVRAQVSLDGNWMNLVKTETNGYTLDTSDKSGMSNKVLKQESFAIQLWNAKGEKIVQSGLTPDSFKDGGMFTGGAGFQFKTT